MTKKTSIKKQVYLDPFDNPHYKYFAKANVVLAVMTLISIASVAMETVASLQVYSQVFIFIEWLSVVLFSTEYIIRIYLSSKRIGYIFSFFGIIDLIAILPSILGIANLTFLKSVRTVRIIRLLRMLRLAKFTRTKDKKEAASSVYKINLEIYLITILLATLLIGSLFYIFESQAEASSIPSGMYWALKSILGGLPYSQPETLGGIFALILARFTSMILLGMMLGLVGMMVRKLLIGSESDT